MNIPGDYTLKAYGTNRDRFTQPKVQGTANVSRSLGIRKNEFTVKGFHYAAFKSWNDTPAEIRQLLTLDRLKKPTKMNFK